jgi:hypothetical protein
MKLAASSDGHLGGVGAGHPGILDHIERADRTALHLHPPAVGPVVKFPVGDEICRSHR